MRLYLHVRWASHIHILLVCVACQFQGPVALAYISMSIATLGDNRRSVDNRFDVYAPPEVSRREQSRSVPAISFLDVHAHAPTITLLDADADVAEGLDPEELECTTDTGPKFEQTPSAQSFSSPCPTRHMADPGHLNRRSPPPTPRPSEVCNMRNLNWDVLPVLDQDGLLDPGGGIAAPTQEFLITWRTRTEAQLQVNLA